MKADSSTTRVKIQPISVQPDNSIQPNNPEPPNSNSSVTDRIQQAAPSWFSNLPSLVGGIVGSAVTTLGVLSAAEKTTYAVYAAGPVAAVCSLVISALTDKLCSWYYQNK